MLKRYQLSLTEENVIRVQAALKRLKLGRNALSKMVDENLPMIAEFLEELADKVETDKEVLQGELLTMALGKVIQSMNIK